MLQDGLIQEVQNLLDAGYNPDLSSLSAIGYKQIISHLLEDLPLEEAIRQIRSKTRKYVRQQANWFRDDDTSIDWFRVKSGIEDEISTRIQHFLS
jgi:tRNA dimethylallyltransferase